MPDKRNEPVANPEAVFDKLTRLVAKIAATPKPPRATSEDPAMLEQAIAGKPGRKRRKNPTA